VLTTCLEFLVVAVLIVLSSCLGDLHICNALLVIKWTNWNTKLKDSSQRRQQ